MRNDFSVINELFKILEGLDDMEDQDNDNSEELVESKKITKIFYSLREWQEPAFLEHTELILADTSYCHIQEITLESGKVVYLVPESFYIGKADEINVRADEVSEEKKTANKRI